MKSFLKNNLFILALYFVALIFACNLIFNFEKPITHIYLNQFVGNSFLNVFFFYITYLGDGLVAPFLLLIILICNVRLGIYSTISFLTASLSSQVLKRCFFDDTNRPSYVFQWDYPYPIHYIDGVDVYLHNSFPSGHATQAFSIFMCLVFATKNMFYKLLFFALAMATALSRVYLSQHWLTDITAGSLVGLFFSILFYHVIIQKNKFSKLNKPISALKKQ